MNGVDAQRPCFFHSRNSKTATSGCRNKPSVRLSENDPINQPLSLDRDVKLFPQRIYVVIQCREADVIGMIFNS